MRRYASQIMALCPRLTFTASSLPPTPAFSWENTFTEEMVTQPGLEFERNAVLFNLAALEACSTCQSTPLTGGADVSGVREL